MQYGEPEQQLDVPHPVPSHVLLVGGLQTLLVQVSPVQHAEFGEHAWPLATQVGVVFDVQWLDTHRPEQHDEPVVQLAPSPEQVEVPLAPHFPDVQRLVQHWLGEEQASPSGLQVLVVPPQRPLVQVSPEQHVPQAPHSCPEPTQVGVTLVQLPPAHVPEQHCELELHAAPGNAHDTKS